MYYSYWSYVFRQACFGKLLTNFHWGKDAIINKSLLLFKPYAKGTKMAYE